MTVDGAQRATTQASWDGATVDLVLAEPLRWGETVTVAYAKPESGTVLRDADEHAVASFGPAAVAPFVARLTAAFVDMPAEHDGNRLFRFELRFSEDFPGRFDYKVLRDHALVVTGGTVREAKRIVRGRNDRWAISVRPASHEAVTITLPAGSVAIEDGRTLADTASATVAGPASLSVADAEATEGADAAVAFLVSLTQPLGALAGVLGAPGGPPPAGDSGFGSPGPGAGQAWSGPGSGSGAGSWPGTGLSAGEAPATGSAAARTLSGRELLLGSAFHLAAEGDGAAPGLAAWGRVTTGGFDGEAPADTGSVRVDGNVTTGVLDADAKWDRLLAGVAISVSEGEGTFDQPGVDSGTIESTMTAVSPYARYMVNERVSVWGLAGWGTGDMTIVQAANDRGQPERVTRTDLGMRLALEGSQAFRMDGGGTLTPSLELGLRHDGGDAETGMGVELGGGVSCQDPEAGLSVEAKTRMLVAHADSDYREWGVSGAVRLAPGERGRGLSVSLSPVLGQAASGAERLWGARDARGLQGELGYGLALFGDRFTGTPNVGFGLSDNAREYRIGWRLTSAVRGDPGFRVDLDAMRREAANGNAPPEHGVMLRAAVRWRRARRGDGKPSA